MKYLLPNTLAHYNSAPQNHQHDLSSLPVSVFSASTKQYREHCGLSSPDADAVTFYTLNHAASIVRKSFTPNEPLPEWAQTIMQAYTDACMSQGERLLHYILSITTREMRHLSSYGKAANKWQKIEAAGGPVMREFIEKIVTMDESKAVTYYMNHPPQATVGQYIKAMQAGFHHGKWGTMVDGEEQCGYGGQKWGFVADAAAEMLHGATSMEMLVDTGYTLAHNGGPIFNKGMMYNHYNDQFMTVLDIQRSGQMLDMIADTTSYTHNMTKTVVATQAVELIKLHTSQELKGYIDWKLVDEYRPAKDKAKHPNKYSKQIGVQTQPSKPAKVKAKVAKAKPAVPEFTTLLGKKVKITGTWKVSPHQAVTTVERVEP